MWRNLFLVGCLTVLVSPIAFAKVLSATWGVSPAEPIYVGQPYELRLTLKTEVDETVPDIRWSQELNRKWDVRTDAVEGNVRYTVFAWKQCEANPKVASLPTGRVLADVVRTQQFGFMVSTQRTQQIIDVPAFAYTVVALPDEAKALPLGCFTLSLTSDRATYAAGEVRLLTATLTAREGNLPEAYTFALESPSGGRVYPFQTVAKDERQWVAQAYFVTPHEPQTALRLCAFEAFDLATRARKRVECAPLTLRLQTVEAQQADDIVLSRQGDTQAKPTQLLRFAPSESAPIVGVVEGAWQEEARYKAWIRVRTPQGAGWLLERNLKE